MKKILLLGLTVLLFSSCIGMSANIQLRRDGSGRLVLEYRFSRMAEAIGRLDGNERWNIIPTGRADWERTVQRIDGMSLVSFSSRESSSDISNSVTLEFRNVQALLNFLDPLGGKAALSMENDTGNLRIILSEPVSSFINADLIELLKQVSAGYSFNINFGTYKNSTLSFTDGTGKEIEPPTAATIIPDGRRVSMEIATSDMLDLRDGLGVIFNW